MAQFFSPILGSIVSGSIGNVNFFPHQGRSLIRSKPIPCNSISAHRCLCRNSLLNAQYWSRWIRTRPGVHKWELRADNRILTRFGRKYKLSVHNTVCLIQSLNSRIGVGYSSPTGNVTGVLRPINLSLDILNTPNYASIILATTLPQYHTLFFWWSFPQHKRFSSYSGGYPNFTAIAGPTAGPITLSGPRITGHTYIYYRWRTIDVDGRFSPTQVSVSDVLNWT